MTNSSNNGSYFLLNVTTCHVTCQKYQLYFKTFRTLKPNSLCAKSGSIAIYTFKNIINIILIYCSGESVNWPRPQLSYFCQLLIAIDCYWLIDDQSIITSLSPTQTPLCGFTVTVHVAERKPLKFCSDAHVFERFTFFAWCNRTGGWFWMRLHFCISKISL